MLQPPSISEDRVRKLLPSRNLLILIGLVLLTILAWSPFSADNSKALYAYFLDVGQGDCILIKTPSGRTMLVDGGGRPNSPYTDVIGRNVVVPALRKQGLNRIDVVVLTHPHDDHVQGLIPVLQDFRIGMVLDPALPHGSDSYMRFLAEVKKRKIPYKRAVRGQTVNFGDGVCAIVLHPPDERLKEVSSYLNANSVVLRVTYGSSSLLLTGDAEKKAEDEMLSAGMNVESDVLKVAHHGSRSATSEHWLDRVKPRIAVISVGQGNQFGHPSPEVLERLARRRIRVFRTDCNGAVMIRMTTRSLRVKPVFPSVKD